MTHQLICTCCKETFAAKRKDAKTCSTLCRDTLRRRKAGTPKRKKYNSIERALKNLSQNAFGYWLTSIIRRAGTVEIVPRDSSYDDLLLLYKLHHSLRFANGLGSLRCNMYHLCHLVPLSQPDHLGILHPSNLIIAPAFLNQSHGNKVFRHHLQDTLSIPKQRLQDCWRVTEGATSEGVCELLDLFLEGSLTMIACVLDLKPSKGMDKAASTNEGWGMEPVEYSVTRTVRHFQRYHQDSRISFHRDDCQLDGKLTQDLHMFQYLLTGQPLVTGKQLDAAFWGGWI